MSSRPRLGLDRWTHLTKDASNCYAVVGGLINTLKPPYITLSFGCTLLFLRPHMVGENKG